MLQIKLESGEQIIGTPNYVTVKRAELRLADGTYRTIDRAQITSVQPKGR